MEIVLFLIIVIAFLILTFLKVQRGVSFFIISVIVLLLTERKFDVHILMNGAFGYFDAVLTVLSATMFVVAIERSGLLHHLAKFLTYKLSSKPRLLLLLSTLLVMSGGMITGSSSASVLTTGAVAFPVLKAMGLDDKRSGALIAVSSVLGMIAPPVNIQAMVICEGVDMPYVGFTYPLLWLTVPFALLSALIIAGKSLRRPTFEEKMVFSTRDIVLYIPLLLFVVLSILDGIGVTQLGLVLIFFLSAISAVFCGRKRSNFVEISLNAMEQSLPILSILVGVGMLIEVMTLSGVRGFIVANMLFLPLSVLFLTVGIGVPTFGAISSYGAASVLGVPFLLAFRGGNDVLIASAISLLSGLGDMLPPTALVPTISAQVVGVDSYFEIFKKSTPFLVIIAVVSVITVARSLELAKLFSNPWWSFGTIGMIFGICFVADSIKKER